MYILIENQDFDKQIPNESGKHNPPTVWAHIGQYNPYRFTTFIVFRYASELSFFDE